MKTKQGVEYEVEVISDGSGINISHFKVKPNRRREKNGTVVLEEVITEYKQKINISYVIVNMKGGGTAAKFLKKNGFHIIEGPLSDGHITAEKEL